jgi:hypothetical protein
VSQPEFDPYSASYQELLKDPIRDRNSSICENAISFANISVMNAAACSWRSTSDRNRALSIAYQQLASMHARVALRA